MEMFCCFWSWEESHEKRFRNSEQMQGISKVSRHKGKDEGRCLLLAALNVISMSLQITSKPVQGPQSVILQIKQIVKTIL